MPFDRSLSDEMVEALIESTFWPNLCRDRELFPEIRRAEITVYYRAKALIRSLTYDRGKFFASINRKFVPVQHDGDYVSVEADKGGELDFVLPVGGKALGPAGPTDLKDYKRLIRAECGPEGRLVQNIIGVPVKRQGTPIWNVIVDQELAFVGSEEDPNNRIDLAYFDRKLNKLVFAEVKRRRDDRLKSTKNEGTPKVVGQLSRYCRQLNDAHDEIVRAFKNVISLKDRLGLGPRLDGLPGNADLEILMRPILVIGDMSEDDVGRFRLDWNEEGGDQGWRDLTSQLHRVTYGVILTGDGTTCRLDWEQSPQKLLSRDSVE